MSKDRNQAFHTLISSIIPEANQHTGNPDPNALRKLSEKLGELVGEDAIKGFNQARNERGELVNEEGLPIIDITEPIAASAEQGDSNTLLVEEDRLIPVSSHPSSARERWQKERDRILDLLEEEERRDQVREEQVNEEQRQQILRKRREAAAHEKAKLKAAKGMQKKLGKALLRGMAETREKGEDGRQILSADETSKTKKTVTFADPPNEDNEGNSTTSLQPKPIEEWGDVVPARLRSTPGPSLLSSRQPMKLAVVERYPASQQTPLPITAAKELDSDDESEPSLPDDSEKQVDSPQFPVKYDDNVPPDSDVDENFVLEDEDFDLDFARHQREIALQYHEKRSEIGEVAATAMMNHSHSDDDVSTADTPLDVPSSQQSRPPISRFKANRIAASYNASTPSSTSTSLGTSVLPASSARTLQRAIRSGKLDADERLVGGEADSASEDENEGMQEVLELLRKGEVYNLGPDGNHIHAIPPNTSSDDGQLNTSATSFAAAPNPQPNPLPPLNRPKTSKFKLSRSRPERSTPDVAPPLSPSASSQDRIPMSHGEGSSRKSPAAMTNIVMERPLPTTSATITSLSSSAVTPTVNGSPSVLPPTPVPTSRGPLSTGAQAFSMVVDSPSFPRSTPPAVTSSHAASRPSRPPTVVASTVQYPSRQGSASTNAAARKAPTILASPSLPQSTRPSTPPAVMSSVDNKSSNRQDAVAQEDVPPQDKRISRFMAERM